MQTFAPLLLLACLVASQSAADVTLSATSRSAMVTGPEWVTGGVPFAQGTVRDTSRLRLIGPGGELPAQFRVTARWPDDSVRWVLLDTQAQLSSSSPVTFTLQTNASPTPFSGIAFTDTAERLDIDTGARRFAFTKSQLVVEDHTFEVVSNGVLYGATPSSWIIEEAGPMKVVVRVEGRFRSDAAQLGSDLVGFRARLTFRRNDAPVHVALTFRNNGGFNWDGGRTRGEDIVLTGARFGRQLLGGGSFTFGPGVEKTWRLVADSRGTPAVADVRFAADGRVADGWATPQPLLVATAAYYASTRAWGVLAAPVEGAGEMQSDFDRFEKMQRAKIIAADVENPPNTTGITIWSHLAQDLGSWNDFGDLRWDGNGCGTLSGNHYDWSYGMYLQFMRTSRVEFADAARVFAAHEIDFDVYHTGDDGPAYNYQKNWEDRPSHDSPENCFGGGRPTHTWAQGYALHWLLTGDPRGRDAFYELQEGIRQYLYESFVDDGRVDTNEIRTQGWIVDNLIALWRIDPASTLTTPRGQKTIPQVLRDVLQNVFEREADAGSRGFVYASPPGADENSWSDHLRAPLQNAYFLEPAIKAHAEVFTTADPAFAASLLALIRRMTEYLMSVTYGGDLDAGGSYRPRQIPYVVDTRQTLPVPGEGQIPYLLMAANAAGYLHSATGESRYADYGRAAFRDYVRYVGAIPGDTYGDPEARTPASFNSTVFTGTESKIHGWSSRYGQYFLASQSSSTSTPRPATLRRRAVRP